MNRENYYNIVKILFCLLFPVFMGSIAFFIEIDGKMNSFIREYQTLISSFAGILVSVVGIIVVVHQINETSRIEADFRKRKVNSAVAGITDELSSIIRWTDRINNNYKSLININEDNENSLIDKGFNLMLDCNINTEEFKSMHVIMENTDDQGISDRIANLFHNIQINKSRHETIQNHKNYVGTTNRMILKHNIYENMSLNIRINAIASDIISETRFSLGDNDRLKPSQEKIKNSLSVLDIYEDEFPEIHRILGKQ